MQAGKTAQKFEAEYEENLPNAIDKYKKAAEYFAMEIQNKKKYATTIFIKSCWKKMPKQGNLHKLINPYALVSKEDTTTNFSEGINELLEKVE